MRLRPQPGSGFSISSTLPRLRTRRRTARGHLLTSAVPEAKAAEEIRFGAEDHAACMAGLAAIEQALAGENRIEACLEELKKLRKLLPTKALGFEFFTAFHLLSEQTQACLATGSRRFLPLILHKCVRDMRHYFERKYQRPNFPWLPKWKFYFDSLKIAGAHGGEARADASSAASGPDLDPEMLEVFAEEANGLLEAAERALLNWEAMDNPEEQQRALRRAWHTLKGAANSLDLRALGQGFHVLEDFVQTADPHHPPAFTFSFLFSTLDQTRGYVAGLAFSPPPAWNHDWAAELARLRQGQGGGAAPAAAPAAESREKALVRVEAEKLQALLHDLSETGLIQLRLESGLRELETFQASLSQKGQAGEAKALAHLLRTLRGDHDQARRRLKQLQTDLASLNMTPANVLFRRLQRVFRDAIQQEGKNAALVLEGGGTLLDRSVLDALFDPLLHLVRNAVAHGLESNARRQALGKPESGTVLLRAVPFSNQVVFEVRDDGAGIRTDKVLARAIERGLVSPETRELSPSQAVNLLFTPGFSTADTVTEVAGRGVGLDAVKQQIESLNGTLSVDSTEGVGSLWSVTVPLSLSALEILEIGAGGQNFAFPLSQVEQCLLLDGSRLRDGRYSLRGEELPFHPLAALLGMGAEPPAHRHGVVVNTGSDRALIGVDMLVARREAILKSLGFLEPRMPWFAGAALDGRGTWVPVLHLAALLRRASGHPVSSPPPKPAPPSQPQGPAVLVVDDSPSVRSLLRQMLETFGFSVTEACDGEEALAQLEGKRFHLILTDQEMPRKTGLDFLRAVNAHPAAKGTPALMITSLREESLQAAAREAGAFAFLPKPPREEDLRSVLQELKLLP
jgi:chemotaxis protein histidine kinase CheA